MKKTALIITALFLLVVAVFVISGFRGGITGEAITCNKPYMLVGNDCCLDSNDNQVCDKDETEPVAEPVEPPREEVPTIVENPVIGAPEELPEGQFTIKLGESVQFEGKTVKLVSVENIPDLKGTYSIDGVEREVYGTKKMILVNGVKITNLKYLQLENGFIVKLEKLVLNDNEYLVNTREDKVIKGKTFKLKSIITTESGDVEKINLFISGDGIGDSILIPEGKTEEFAGLKITNLHSFPSGFKSENQAIIKVL